MRACGGAEGAWRWTAAAWDPEHERQRRSGADGPRPCMAPGLQRGRWRGLAATPAPALATAVHVHGPVCEGPQVVPRGASPLFVLA
jgi:hypothetical protein